MQAPCKDCPDRSVTCHANCEKYREFATANAEQRKQRNIENVGRQYTIEKYNKAVKKRRNKGFRKR